MTLGDYCSAKREGGRIVIEIPEAEMLRHFVTDPDFPRVADAEPFLDALTVRLLQAPMRRGEEFTTCFEDLIRKTAHQAAESLEEV